MNNHENTVIVDDTNKIRLRAESPSVCVVIPADNGFINYLGVLLSSIVKNAGRDNHYDIIIMTTDITESGRQDILALQKPNITIYFAYVNGMIDSMNFGLSGRYTKFTFFRMLIPEILEGIDKVIYLDADTLVLCDIADLYHIDLEDKLVAATFDPLISAWQSFDSGMRPYFNKLGIGEPGKYIQAGVLLLNVKEIQKTGIMKTMLEEAFRGKYILNDQDILNIYIKNRVKFIDPRWNVININSEALDICEKYLDDKLKQSLLSARKEPYIIHFVEQSFPDKKIRNKMYSDFYKEYAKSTPFGKKLSFTRESGKENGEIPAGQEQVVQNRRSIVGLLKAGAKKLRYFLVKNFLKDMGWYKALKKLLKKNGVIVSYLDLTKVDISGESRFDGKYLVLSPGAELSCIHGIWGIGKHDVVLEVCEGDGMKEAYCALYSGCRHIELEKRMISEGKSRLACDLEDSHCDIEFVVNNTSASELTIKKIRLEHR